MIQLLQWRSDGEFMEVLSDVDTPENWLKFLEAANIINAACVDCKVKAIAFVKKIEK